MGPYALHTAHQRITERSLAQKSITLGVKPLVMTAAVVGSEHRGPNDRVCFGGREWVKPWVEKGPALVCRIAGLKLSRVEGLWIPCPCTVCVCYYYYCVPEATVH